MKLTDKIKPRFKSTFPMTLLHQVKEQVIADVSEFLWGNGDKEGAKGGGNMYLHLVCGHMGVTTHTCKNFLYI